MPLLVMTAKSSTMTFKDDGVIIYENRSQLLGALGSGSVILIGTKLAMTDSFRMLKAEINALVTLVTSGEGGGLQLYLCEGSLTTTEIAEALNNDGPLTRGDVVSNAQAMRPIFRVGAVGAIGGAAAHFNDKDDGPDMTIKPRWTFSDGGVGWNWAIFNYATTPLTDAALVVIQSKSFGVWVGA